MAWKASACRGCGHTCKDGRGRCANHQRTRQCIFAALNRQATGSKIRTSHTMTDCHTGPIARTVAVFVVLSVISCAPQDLSEQALTPEEITNQEITGLRTRAEQGDAAIQYLLGWRYGNGRGVEKDYVEAVRWWKRAADQGNLSAQLTLALRYDNGTGVVQDQAEAVRWYQRAAEQGHVAAQIILGGRYANGRGVEKDDTVAVEWYRMAAEQGNIRAQYSLGVMYETGQGVSQDNVQAYLWYDLGASRPSVEQEQSIKNRDSVASQMTPEEVAEARRLVREWRGANEP